MNPPGARRISGDAEADSTEDGPVFMAQRGIAGPDAKLMSVAMLNGKLSDPCLAFVEALDDLLRLVSDRRRKDIDHAEPEDLIGAPPVECFGKRVPEDDVPIQIDGHYSFLECGKYARRHLQTGAGCIDARVRGGVQISAPFDGLLRWFASFSLCMW